MGEGIWIFVRKKNSFNFTKSWPADSSSARLPLLNKQLTTWPLHLLYCTTLSRPHEELL